MRQKEQQLVELRYNNLVRTNIEKQRVNHNLDKWAASGFSTSKKSKKLINVANSPELVKLSRMVRSGGPKDEDDPDKPKDAWKTQLK